MIKRLCESRNRNEEGAVSIEIILVLPLIVLVMMFLIGMGHILIKKHHALVAARYSAHYRIAFDKDPSSRMIAKAVGSPDDSWTLNGQHEIGDSGSNEEIKVETGKVNDSVGLRSFLSGLLDILGGRNKLKYTASTDSYKGIVPKLSRINDASARYVVEHNTWVCDDGRGNYRGSYLSILTGRIPLIGRFLSWASNKISCCKSYQPENESYVGNYNQ